MEEKENKEVAEKPADNVNMEAMMQMMKHLWPDTNEQKEKEFWRNMHRELIFHYECSLLGQVSDFDELVSKSITYARFTMNEIQAYERGDYKELFDKK